MTTVAYKDGVMAADSAYWSDGTQILRGRKLYRVGGGLVGCAGAIAHWERFVEWLLDGAIEEEFPIGEFDAITVDPSGKARLWAGTIGEKLEMEGGYCAIGSGRDHALGAMAAGADAPLAVRAAAKHDQYTRPPFHSYRLRRKRK